MKEQLLLIGNGPAGMRCVEEVLKRAPTRYQITVFGAERHAPYNRILLSPVLAEEKAPSAITTHDDAWFEERGVTHYKGTRIVAVDRHAKIVTSADGRRFPYDRLILATGSRPFMLPLPNQDLPGIYGFRDLDDVAALADEAQYAEHAVVIGGGLLGLEAAAGLRRRGLAVTVVHLCDTLMEQQLDAQAGAMLRSVLEQRGIQFEMEARTCAYVKDEPSGRVAAIQLAHGRRIRCDLVVVAVGIRPVIDLAKTATLDHGRGIRVDDHMRTSDPAVYAVGECAEHRGRCYGLVAPLFEMATACAAHLTASPTQTPAGYAGSLVSARLKVSGVDLFSTGRVQPEADDEVISLTDATLGVYKKLIINNHRIVGVLLYGDAFDAAWYFAKFAAGESIESIRDQLIFGASFVDGGADVAGGAVAALPDDAEICGCNGVCKGAILNSIATKGLTDLAGVRAHTKASASCGGCTPLVEQLLASALGPQAAPPRKTHTVCGCSDHDHAAVRAFIRENAGLTINQVMAALQWRNAEGCAKCRPALNYYLLCAAPADYVDDGDARFVNERVHANIQKDGTFSVVPRMFGGMTSADQLRAIADVVDKFAIPAVKVTGGQRIDLLGVQKADLPDVWADLNAAGMVSGHAYGKAVRTVKTCVGAEWCRFGVGDSTALGIRLEEELWGSWTPHKVKLAVSGCPRNCAEATIKDIGVIAVESGWEIHIGGNGGTKVRVTELLTKVKSADEASLIVRAFLQLYREDAYYGERTAAWLERVGLAHAKSQVIEDAAERDRLAARFDKAQVRAHEDPWSRDAGLPAKQPQRFTDLKAPVPFPV